MLKICLAGPIGLESICADDSVRAQLKQGKDGMGFRSLLEARTRAGLTSHVATLVPNAPVAGAYGSDGPLEILALPRRGRGELRTLFARERAALRAAFQRLAPDIIHAHWTNCYALAAVESREFPCVVTVHDHARNILGWLGPRYLPLYWMAGYVMKRATVLAAVSPYVADYIRKRVGRDAVVIPNVLDETLWTCTRKAASDGSHVLIIANGSPMKNVRRALLVVRRLTMNHRWPRNARISIVGPGLERESRLAEAYQDLERNGVIRFLGAQNRAQVIALLEQADLLWHPSLEESFGLPVAEALALGIPVLGAMEAEGVRWLLGNGKHGSLVRGKSCKAMGEALISMLNPSSEIQRMALRGQAFIRRLSDSQCILEQYEKLYRSAIVEFSQRR